MDFKSYRKKYEKVKVEEYSHKVSENPSVSICVQTFRQANLIQKCLDGILMQKTTFDFEILLGEDDSQDGTREICKEYAQKNPDKIRLFLHHRENNIAINNKPSGRFNYLFNLYSANGKYIACCEGDDYWTDENKLQKQFDLLENNESFAGCFHDVQVSRNGKITNSHIKFMNPDFDQTKININLSDFIKTNWLISFCSIFYRREYFEIKEYLCSFPNGDFPLYFTLLSKGNLFKFHETMAVYLADNNLSITNNRNVVDRIQFELEKLKFINSQLANLDEINSDSNEIFEAIISRINGIQKLNKVLKNSSVIEHYLKLHSKLSDFKR